MHPSIVTTAARCPCCGRRNHFRPRRGDPPDLPLFAWAARRSRLASIGARVILRDDLRDAEGQPRACIVIPGRRLPLAFPSISAALAALARMEADHAGR